MEASTATTEPTGKFMESLRRNNKQIRDDRATSIVEDTQLTYKRQIEDLETSVKKMRREQENMLDLSPTTTQSLVLASEFDSAAYAKLDLDLGVRIRTSEIRLDIAKERYTLQNDFQPVGR